MAQYLGREVFKYGGGHDAWAKALGNASLWSFRGQDNNITKGLGESPCQRLSCRKNLYAYTKWKSGMRGGKQAGAILWIEAFADGSRCRRGDLPEAT